MVGNAKTAKTAPARSEKKGRKRQNRPNPAGEKGSETPKTLKLPQPSQQKWGGNTKKTKKRPIQGDDGKIRCSI
jgi:hypothetical protein